MGITFLYLIGTLISFAVVFANITQNRKVDSKYIALEISIVANCLGGFVLSLSQTLETAIWANKLLYFGAIFAPLLLLLVSAQVCNVKIPKWLELLGLGYALFVYGLVLTIGYLPVYYQDVSLGFHDGYTYLIKTYGPLHALYPMQLVVYTVLLVIIVVQVIRNRKSMPMLPMISLGVMGIFTITLYFLERLFQSTVEWLVIPYIGAALLMTLWQDRINMYDISMNIANTVDRLKDYGYIVFDRKGRYVNSNQFAKQVFPEIRDWGVDKKVSEEDTLAYQKIVQQLAQLNATKTDLTLCAGERYVKVTVRDIYYHGKKTVGSLVELLDVTLEQKYTNTIESYNSSLEEQVQAKTANIVQMKDNLLKSIAIMVESRDDSTGSHIMRTSEVVRIFSDRLREAGIPGLNDDFLDMVVKAAPLHDLGKISVSDAILLKQGRLTAEEYRKMQIHAEAGAEMADKVLHDSESPEFIQIARNIAHYHHEKWNGTGYPAQLKGADIPIEARIMAFADVFDALASKRCYKEAFSPEKSLDIIREDLGSHFDPQLGKIFLSCRKELIALYQ